VSKTGALLLFKNLPITHPVDLIIELAITNPDFTVYYPTVSIFRPSLTINEQSKTGIRPEVIAEEKNDGGDILSNDENTNVANKSSDLNKLKESMVKKYNNQKKLTTQIMKHDQNKDINNNERSDEKNDDQNKDNNQKSEGRNDDQNKDNNQKSEEKKDDQNKDNNQRSKTKKHNPNKDKDDKQKFEANFDDQNKAKDNNQKSETEN
jgi:hypothetical protein